MHSAEMKTWEPTVNIPATPLRISTENPKTPTKINTTKEKSHRSSTRPPTSKIDNSEKTHIPKPESNSEKIKTMPNKFEHSPESTQPSSGRGRLKASNFSSQITDPSTSKLVCLQETFLKDTNLLKILNYQLPTI